MTLTETTSQIEAARFQYGMLARIMQLNTDGVTHEESLVRAVPTGSHINWVLGHVVATRCLLLLGLRQESPWSEETLAIYRRGSSGAVEANYLPFDEIVRAFHVTQERILSGIGTVSDEEMITVSSASPKPEPAGATLLRLAIHEGYHLGQIGILRRVAGKDGTIK